MAFGLISQLVILRTVELLNEAGRSFQNGSKDPVLEYLLEKNCFKTWHVWCTISGLCNGGLLHILSRWLGRGPLYSIISSDWGLRWMGYPSRTPVPAYEQAWSLALTLPSEI